MKNMKKILGVSILLIFIFVGIAIYSCSKITNFEECENAGWLVCSITIYDHFVVYDSSKGNVEKKCTLWNGKSFIKQGYSSNFGNNQIEKAITDYLLTQKYFSWKTTADSRNVCVIENLNPTENGMFPLYVWVRCGEFVIQNEKLKELSGKSAPAKINYPNQLSFYDINKMSYEVPRDGSSYSEDIKTIFPLNVQEVIFNFNHININKKIEAIAFSDLDNIVK